VFSFQTYRRQKSQVVEIMQLVDGAKVNAGRRQYVLDFYCSIVQTVQDSCRLSPIKFALTANLQFRRVARANYRH